MDIVEDIDLTLHVAAHAGVSQDRARQATAAVLAGFGALLGEPHRRLVADELPPAFAAALLSGEEPPARIADLACAPGEPPGRARELVASVCHVLVEELSEEAVDALRGCAPPELAEWLAPVAPERPSDATADAHHETLAVGRPGSRHPVSEARPRRAQPESVAAPNPHADAKLSSSTGALHERKHETLAEGHPGYAHPIAGSRRGS